MWYPGSQAGAEPAQVGELLLSSSVTQEHVLRLDAASNQGLGGGTFLIQVYALNGAPEYQLRVQTTPALLRVAREDAAALATIQRDCCAPAATGQACQT